MDSENIQNNDNVNGKSLRLLRPSIVVLCGPAACGKSTFAEKHFRPTQVISSDWARARVCDDDRDQRFNVQAFALVHFLVDQRLMLNRLCVVDSTALTLQARKELLDLAKKYQVPATVMCFNVPLETCVERDEKRERTVGRPTIERQYQAFEQTKTTIRREGFDQIIEFWDGDVDKVQIEILFRPTVRSVQRGQRLDGQPPRRFERSTQFSRSNGSSEGAPTRPSVNVQPLPAPPAAPQPAPVPSSVSTTISEPSVAAATPAAAAVTKAATVLPLPSPVKSNKPSILTPPEVPARAVRPRPVPVGAQQAGSGS